MPTRITKRLVDSLKPAAGEVFVWDDKLTGFGVRVQPSGLMSYVFQYRAGSGRSAPRRRLTLARVGQITPDEARDLAKKASGAVANGKDPAREKAADKLADTFQTLANQFLAEHVEAKRKRSTGSHYRGILEKHVLPQLGTRKAEEITTADIARLHHKLKDRPYAANRMLAVVGSLYAFARKRHVVPRDFINPVRDVDKFPEQRRERFLSVEELTKVGDAIREAETIGIPYVVDETRPNAKNARKPEDRRTRMGPHASAAIRLLLFTGARLREILHLQWEHVDVERGLLLLPDSKTGKKTIVLNAPALAVLTALPRVGAYVIAGQNAGTENEGPRGDLKAPWAAVSKRAGLVGVRIHDLRHTHASFGAGAGLGLPIIGKLLGHTQASTTQRYAHLDADPLRKASNIIGNKIAAAMGEAPAKPESGEVLPFRK